MSLTRLHFDTEAKVGVTRQNRRVAIQLAYVGKNTYHVKAKDVKTNKIWFEEIIEYPALKGNGRKAFVKLRDFALNAIEGLSYDAERIV